MGRRRAYSSLYGYNDHYKPPEFNSGDRVRFRGGRVSSLATGRVAITWEILEVGVKKGYDWRDWVRVRSTRSGALRHALPVQLYMVESAGEQVAKVLMGEDT